MARNGLWPATRYSRVACFILAFDLLLFALKKALDLAGSSYGLSSEFLDRSAVIHFGWIIPQPGLPLAESADAVASAQPFDCHLRFRRCDSRHHARHHGLWHSLSDRRPICEFRSDGGTELSPAQPGNDECGHRQ